MKTVSLKDIAKMKKQGRPVNIERTQKVRKAAPAPKVEKVLTDISKDIKKIADKPDTNKDIVRSIDKISLAVSTAVAQIKKIQPEKKINNWDVQIYRGTDSLISSFKLKAIGE